MIVEPVAANMGVSCRKRFLEGLRSLCDQYGALLILTGDHRFRLAFRRRCPVFWRKPDLVTYGKIIGAGMPVGAYGGRRDHGDGCSAQAVYQAGT